MPTRSHSGHVLQCRTDGAAVSTRPGCPLSAMVVEAFYAAHGDHETVETPLLPMPELESAHGD